MSDSNEEEDENPQFLNLPQPTTFFLASINDHIPNTPKQPLIFPPNNHENLHVTPSSDTSSSYLSSSSSSSSYPSSSWDDSSAPSSPVKNLNDPSGVSNSGLEALTQKVNGVPNLGCRKSGLVLRPLNRKVNEVPNWGRWNLEALTRKVNGVVVFVKKFWVVRGVLLILRSPVGQLLALMLYLRWQKRQRRRGSVGVDSSDGRYQHLVRVIREKDERINELLNQIARMNEVLLSMHKVPSSKAG